MRCLPLELSSPQVSAPKQVLSTEKMALSYTAAAMRSRIAWSGNGPTPATAFFGARGSWRVS
jgi:hypothetical protein